MLRIGKISAALAGLLLLPSLVFAQATIAGVVRDASAAVLPGVTVEASSAVLIEKARTAITDGTGQYRMTDLPPGTYLVTFSLQGFTTVKREGVAVSGSGVIAVNADLRVGELTETITVTGASPIVDTQSVRREIVLNNETLSTLPATRGYGSALATVPALNIGGVAGAGATTAPTTPQMMFFTAHGGAAGEGRVMTNGLTVAAPFGGGGVSDVTYDTANAAEMQVLISGGLGEAETGGPSINIVPKSGGNTFQGIGVLQHVRRLGHRQQPQRSAAYLRHHAAADAADQLGRELQPGRSDQARSPVVLRQRPRVGECLGGQRHQRQPLCRRRVALGLFRRYLDRVAPGGRAEDLRRPPHGAADAEEPRDGVARLSAALRRVVAARGRRGLPQGGRRLGRVGTHVRRRHRVARNLPRLPRLPLQHDAGHLFRAVEQPHADRGRLLALHLRLRAVRHGGARRADDAHSRHRAERHLRTHQLLVSRRLRSARLRLQRQRRAQLELARRRWRTSPAPTTSRWATPARSSRCTTAACRTTRSCATPSTPTRR